MGSAAQQNGHVGGPTGAASPATFGPTAGVGGPGGGLGRSPFLPGPAPSAQRNGIRPLGGGGPRVGAQPAAPTPAGTSQGQPQAGSTLSPPMPLLTPRPGMAPPAAPYVGGTPHPGIRGPPGFPPMQRALQAPPLPGMPRPGMAGVEQQPSPMGAPGVAGLPQQQQQQQLGLRPPGPPTLGAPPRGPPSFARTPLGPPPMGTQQQQQQQQTSSPRIGIGSPRYVFTQNAPMFTYSVVPHGHHVSTMGRHDCVILCRSCQPWPKQRLEGGGLFKICPPVV